MRNYDELINAGNAAQMEKLKSNEHKKGFDDITFEYGYNRLVEEVKELRDAFESEPSEEGYKNIRSEAADVANFAHMIILKCDKILKEKTHV